MALFSTTGIRGISNKDMTPEFVLQLAETFAQLLKQLNGERGTILVGRDSRSSSMMLKHVVLSGLQAMGFDVVDTDLIPVPALAYAVKEKFDGGIMITSSHNPPEWNGLKFFLPSGLEISTNEENQFESLLNSEKTHIDWKEIGDFNRKDVHQIYMDRVLEYVDTVLIKKSHLKVVVDPANGAQSILAPKLLRKLGCDVVGIHTDPRPDFARSPEPKPETLGILAKKVLEEKADLGVAFDIDGDRCIFVTHEGIILMGDVTGSLLAQKVLEKNNGKIITPVSTSKLIDDVVQKAQAEIMYTPVGAKYVAEVLQREKGVYGFEENGGCIFPEVNCVRDGTLTAAVMLELLAQQGKSLTQVVSELPQYYQLKARIECPDDKKKQVMKKLEELITDVEVNTIDGFKAEFDDGSVLIRPSGTEPIIRIYSESTSEERVKELSEWGQDKLNKAHS